MTTNTDAVPLSDEQIDELVTRYFGATRYHFAPSRYVAFARALLSASKADVAQPIDMLLFCPRCGTQHIDATETELGRLISGGPNAGRAVAPRVIWDNPPHRSHLCRACGEIWRPADVPTNGVALLTTKGKNDTWRERCPAAPASEVQIDHIGGAAKMAADLTRVYEAFGIGLKARSIDTLLVNISNAMRRSDCLWSIERDFFTKDVPADDPEEDGDTAEECPLNWGATPAEYVEQFRGELAALDAHSTDAAAREHWNPVYNTDPVQRACGELPEGWEIEILLENGAGCVYLIDPRGKRTDIDNADQFDWTIHNAIEAALADNASPAADQEVES